MNCWESICIPIIFMYRCAVHCSPCCFKSRTRIKEPFDVQLQLNTNRKGGYFTNYYASKTCTRETFYTYLSLRLRSRCPKSELKFVQRLAKNMSTDGQVPAQFNSSWYDETPVYMKNNRKVIDANMFFIIMAWHCCEFDQDAVEKLYLTCQRAFEWLKTYSCNDTIYEPVGVSWEDTRKHSGHLLLTNIIMIRTIRCMEMLACTFRDERQERRFKHLYDQALAKWVPEIYKSQETLPRILAVHWNLVPRDFIVSFNQELQCPYVPLRTAGPVRDDTTWTSWLYGRDDLHTEIIWPWVGFFWICVLVKHSRRKIAQGWWTSYIEYHQLSTLHDIYAKDTYLPVRRAFLKAMPAHSLTLSMHMAAHQLLHGLPTARPRAIPV